jgi:hypothetical protein
MWCSWISSGHNPASTQPRVQRALNTGLRESLASRLRLMASRGTVCCVELTQPPGNLVPTGGC